MIFLHNEINLEELANDNSDLKKSKTSLDSNIVYCEFKELDGEYKTKFVNLTQDVFNEETKIFDINKFNENIDLANPFFLNDLKTKINDISEQTGNNSSDLLSFLSKENIMGNSFYLNAGDCINGANCYGTKNFLLSYISSDKPNNSLKKIRNIKNVLKVYDKNEAKFIFSKNLIENIELFDKVSKNIDLLDLNLLYKNNKLIFDSKKTTIFIWNIEGIRNQYIIENELNNIKTYFNTIIFNDELELSNVSCKCCLRKDNELLSSEKMTKYLKYVKMVEDKEVFGFNLENIKENDFSFIVCSTCKQTIEKNNELLGQYNFVLLKENIGFNSKVEVAKKYYKEAVEILNSNDFGYLYKINKFKNDVYNFSYEFKFKSNNNLSIEQIKENYLTINSFLKEILNNSKNKNEYSFLKTHYLINKNEYDFFIDKYFKYYMDFYLNGNKLPLNVYLTLFNQLNLMKIKNDEYIYFFESLKKLTNIGEENMNIKEIVNSKLTKFEEDNSNLELTDKELIVLLGSVLSYLNNKSKKSDKTLNYIANIKNYNVKNLNRILSSTFDKYAFAIGDNQIKLRTIISHILTNLENIKLNNSEIKTMFLIGALAGKQEIKLTKN